MVDFYSQLYMSKATTDMLFFSLSLISKTLYFLNSFINISTEDL